MSQPKTVIITGGNGFVGQHLLSELSQHWPQTKLVVWDRDLINLPAGAVGLKVDITKPRTYLHNLRKHQPKWLVHLAAIASVPTANKEPGLTFAVNTRATQDLLQTIKKHSHHTNVLAVSSADIYGFTSTTPLPELPLSQAHPRNPYAQSKLEMERIIVQFFNAMVLRVRPFPHIGPGQKNGFVTADFASRIAAAEAGRQEPIIQVGNLDTKRDFTDVRDVVKAYRLLMEKGRLGEVYHVASGQATAISDLLHCLITLSTITIKTIPDPDKIRPLDIKVITGDASKLSQATNWYPMIKLDKSLADILNFWRDHVSAS